MPGGLPEGLVSNKEEVSGEIQRVDRVEAEDVQRLWRVYSSKKTALAENVGQRLENFFWRIWSSRRIRERITGTQVALQFSRINEGGYIRTTPTPSPRSSRSLGSYYRAARSHETPTSSVSQAPSSPTEADSSPSTGEDEASSVTPTPTSPLSAGTKSGTELKGDKRSSTSTRPPPILKKSSTGSSSSSNGESSKIATVSPTSSRHIISSSTNENDEAVILDDSPTPTDSSLAPSRRSMPYRRSTNTTRFNEEVAVSIPKPSTTVIRSAKEKTGRSSSGESSQKSGRRNPVVVASTGASRTRPAAGRRKSSGTSSLGNSRTSSYSNLARSPKSLLLGARGTPSREMEAPSVRRAGAASPHPSKNRKPLPPDPSSSEELSDDEDEGEAEESPPTMSPKGKSKAVEDDSGSSSDEKIGAPKPLVDPNFRSRFIGKTRSAQGSLTSLPSLLRKSAAAAAAPTSASYQAAGMMESGQPTSSADRVKGKDAFTNVIAPLKAPAAAGPEASDDDNDPQPLPRTKSQLTLLLEREKNRSTNEEQVVKKVEKPRLR